MGAIGHNSPRYKVIISDYHIGTTLWQKAILEELGCQVEVQTLSGHHRYLRDDYRVDPFFEQFASKTDDEIATRFKEVNYVVCSFPPVHAIQFRRVPKHVSIILNIAHRIQICSGYTASALRKATEDIVMCIHDKQFIVACMSEYDYQYIKYYCSVDVPRLLVASFHIPKGLRCRLDGPTNHTVLVGPSHCDKLIGFSSIEQMNRISVEYAHIYQRTPFKFAYIKSIYPNTTFEQLVAHPAVIIFPYSAFSISMVELYHLNIPFFVPGQDILRGNMNDVKLYPLYCPETEVNDFDKNYIQDSTPSPNSVDGDLHWLQYIYPFTVKNSLRYNTTEELFRLLYTCDLQAIREMMRNENDSHFDRELQKWRTVIDSSAV